MSSSSLWARNRLTIRLILEALSARLALSQIRDVRQEQKGKSAMASIRAGQLRRSFRRASLQSSVFGLAIIAFISFVQPIRAEVSTNLQSYWPLNGTGEDESGFDRDLTLQGGVGFGAGLFGSALSMFKNQSTYANRTVDDSVFDFGPSDFTVQAWVNYNSIATEQVLLEKFSGISGPGWTLTKLDNQVYRLHADSALVLDSPVLSISTGTWHQVIARRSGTNVQLWFDHSLIANGFTGGAISNSPTGLFVGRRNTGDPRDFSMNGRLDEVAIWSRALSDEDINFLWNNGAGRMVPEPTTAGLIFLAALYFGMKRRHRRP